MGFPLLTSVVALAVLAAAVPQPVGQKNGITIPLIKRSVLVNADKSVNIEALRSQVASAEAKVLRGLNNFEKNTGTPHPSVLKGVRRRATGADLLTNDNNELWYGSISVGTPSNNFAVDFDTGSSDLFLPGPNCSSTCAGHRIYNPSDSSTSQDLGRTFAIAYGYSEYSSTVSGELFTDTVSVAGLKAVGQTLGVASTYSSNFAASAFPPDGLMGLAFESISGFGASPVFQTLVSQGQTDQPVFSFKLGATGELYIGGVDQAMYTGDVTYNPVTTAGYWQVNMDGIEGNGKTILRNVDSIIDTGTTLIVGDPMSVRQFYKDLGGADASITVGNGFYTFPCASFPSVSFTFGGTSFPISAETLNIGPVSSGSTDCVSGIVGQPTGYSFWIIGDVFLQNVYSVFDLGQQRVGFAQLA